MWMVYLQILEMCCEIGGKFRKKNVLATELIQHFEIDDNFSKKEFSDMSKLVVALDIQFQSISMYDSTIFLFWRVNKEKIMKFHGKSLKKDISRKKWYPNEILKIPKIKIIFSDIHVKNFKVLAISLGFKCSP